MSRSSFIAGFAEELKEKGLSPASIHELWKSAEEFKESSEMIQGLTDDLANPVNPGELNHFINQQAVLKTAADIAEAEKSLENP